ncbi:MAG: hypothetical protein A2161_07990 [Candidatus Schekmanbacteria bacterium RBG_13_48_7]|uniref:Uncharacterized protein n=1 Tax=Candidatus Schekmanbacteria bacterium RBG_13_48_7 TaxID=1817878 RepID=A0A1F7RPC7_9BACT|nr:MAG: hypothetical protein A2161_07990 [Candidatus Schekmanbacteria bacterium RBG_13_48_7]
MKKPLFFVLVSIIILGNCSDSVNKDRKRYICMDMNSIASALQLFALNRDSFPFPGLTPQPLTNGGAE